MRERESELIFAFKWTVWTFQAWVFFYLIVCLTINLCSIQCGIFLFYLCSHIMSLFLLDILPPCSLHKRRWILHMCHIHVHILRLVSIWTFSRWSKALLHNNKPQAFLSDLALSWALKLFGCYFLPQSSSEPKTFSSQSMRLYSGSWIH